MDILDTLRRLWSRDMRVARGGKVKNEKSPRPPRFASLHANLAPKIPRDVSLIGQFAPIAVFCYRRPDHLRRTLETLRANALASQSDLFIFCDGAKSDQDRSAVLHTRAVAREQSWCGRVHIVESDLNCGLSTSISSGVTQLCERFGRAIVLEDDLITAPDFLEYVNHALDKYADESNVHQISGYMFPVQIPEKDSAFSAFFLPLTTSWGWATWQRSWRKFSNDVSSARLDALDEAARQRFDLDGNFPFSRMLLSRVRGHNDSWAILWYLTVFSENGLVLFPPETLIENIGFDGTGVHSRGAAMHSAVKDERCEIILPDEICEDSRAFSMVKIFLRSTLSGAA